MTTTDDDLPKLGGPVPRARDLREPGVRLEWDWYFMDIAEQVSTRATCDRKHVGAVIVRDRSMLSTGYNGALRSLPHCDDVGHEIEGGVPEELEAIAREVGEHSRLTPLVEALRAKLEGRQHCTKTVHAEANAIVQAARNGVNINGSTLYTTASPCWHCFKLIANAGIVRVVFGEFYRDERVFAVAKDLGIELVDIGAAE